MERLPWRRFRSVAGTRRSSGSSGISILSESTWTSDTTTSTVLRQYDRIPLFRENLITRHGNIKPKHLSIEWPQFWLRLASYLTYVFNRVCDMCGISVDTRIFVGA
uniref:Uncharacterized protein n=1 Tax=Ixodes ricinus TaxID=34613 RepID=A0A0K8RMC7_IXORI